MTIHEPSAMSTTGQNRRVLAASTSSMRSSVSSTPKTIISAPRMSCGVTLSRVSVAMDVFPMGASRPDGHAAHHDKAANDQAGTACAVASAGAAVLHVAHDARRIHINRPPFRNAYRGATHQHEQDRKSVV